ncbi:MAG: hypothetical protein UY54_C0012G0022 [Parcubacteria group bacterium GW2011_GWA2_50_10b]|nr:MAG: hypothetical protein UY54_C0012G0022 [Parcubacteria group bacterium GW2011_GWA2_50_10b]
MATVQRFEDLVCWKKSRELTSEIYRSFRNCKDYGFTDQIQRASVSIMSNISEGFESGTRDSFVNYLYIAKGSAGEVRAQLYAASDIGYLNIQTFQYLKNNAEECSKLLNSFIKAVKSSPNSGLQRKREMTKDEQETESFLADAREQLAKIHPGIYGKKP